MKSGQDSKGLNPRGKQLKALRQGAFVLTICLGTHPGKEEGASLGSALPWQLQAVTMSVLNAQFHRSQVTGRSFGGLGC